MLAILVARRVRGRRRAWLDESLARVEEARARPPEAARLALATLLRRVMRHRHGEAVDALQGEAWLARLDAEFGGRWFREGDGRVFGDALYRPPDMVNAPSVDTLCDALATRLRRLPPSPGDATTRPSTERA